MRSTRSIILWIVGVAACFFAAASATAITIRDTGGRALEALPLGIAGNAALACRDNDGEVVRLELDRLAPDSLRQLLDLAARGSIARWASHPPHVWTHRDGRTVTAHLVGFSASGIPMRYDGVDLLAEGGIKRYVRASDLSPEDLAFVQACGALGGAAGNPRDFLAHPCAKIRERALDALYSEISKPRPGLPPESGLLFEHFAMSLADSEDSVRWHALRCLEALRDPRSVLPLARVAAKDSKHNQSRAVFALGRIKDPGALPTLLALLADPASTSELRQECAQALGEIGDSGAVPALLSCLSDTGSGAAAMSLAILDPAAAAPAILEALPPSWSERGGFATALWTIRFQPRNSREQVYLWMCETHAQGIQRLKDHWAVASDIFREDLASDDTKRFRNAILALLSVGDTTTVPDLVAALDRRGDKALAETYLNCGQPELASAARTWASRHGFEIKPNGGAGGFRWGGP